MKYIFPLIFGFHQNVKYNCLIEENYICVGWYSTKKANHNDDVIFFSWDQQVSYMISSDHSLLNADKSATLNAYTNFL